MRRIIYLFLIITLGFLVNGITVFENQAFNPSESNVTYVFEDQVGTIEDITVDKLCVNISYPENMYAFCGAAPSPIFINITADDLTRLFYFNVSLMEIGKEWVRFTIDANGTIFNNDSLLPFNISLADKTDEFIRFDFDFSEQFNNETLPKFNISVSDLSEKFVKWSFD
jgi:hypothetical protein